MVSGSYLATVAHEYFHSLMHMYNIHSSTCNRSKWFHESFASLAGLLYANYRDNKDAYYSGWSRIYLEKFNAVDSNLYSLDSTYNSKHYGSFVLPLYIYERYGGMQTIRRILEQRNVSGPYPYYYINDALTIHQGTSFEDVFTGFSTANAYPFDSFTFPYSFGWDNDDILNQFVQTGEVHYFQNYLAPMSADYTRLYSSESFELILTIEADNPDFALSTIRTLPNLQKENSSWDMSTGRITIVIPTFSEYDADDITIVGISTNWWTNPSMNYSIHVQTIGHQHDYSEYRQYDDYNHKKICDCGSYVLEKHKWSFLPDGRGVCTKCGYVSPIIIW